MIENIQHLACLIYLAIASYFRKQHNLLLFFLSGEEISLYIYTPHFPYPFICFLTSRLVIT